MAWKEVWRNEDEEARELLGRAGYGIVGRQKIRMTVEEEVSECCEKWRGGVTLGKMAAAWDWKTEAKFCPECGRRL
ncbi:MAG: hypothetical protein WC565_06305 [Parcubacteria group bacterium]